MGTGTGIFLTTRVSCGDICTAAIPPGNLNHRNPRRPPGFS
jgi:hypothetical protein